MKHLTIADFGAYLGITHERLVVKQGETSHEFPLNRLKTLTVAKKGVSLSSDLVQACSQRGIKIFFVDFRGVAVAALVGTHQHAVAKVRRNQFLFLEAIESRDLARQFVKGKIRNQRVLLKYFEKYQKKTEPERGQVLLKGAGSLEQVLFSLKDVDINSENWLQQIMGYEGRASAVYWQALREAGLFPESFKKRIGRGATDVTNSMLNYGYAILSGYIWHCVINAGLEPFVGVLHQERPGKPALVLDLMEEYRPWVVDRLVVTLRQRAKEPEAKLTPNLKKKLIEEIHKTFAKKCTLKGKKLRLETILQRQVYRLCGYFAREQSYKPYIFTW